MLYSALWPERIRERQQTENNLHINSHLVCEMVTDHMTIRRPIRSWNRTPMLTTTRQQCSQPWFSSGF